MQDVLLTALGQAIKRFRKKRGFSQEGFADLCGVHRTFMGAVERGETNLSFNNLVKIAKTLGLKLSELLEGLEEAAASLAGDPPSKPAAMKARSG